MKSRPSYAKRNRELARAQRKKDKAEKREETKEERNLRAENASDDEEDPDIAGITPGPQKLDPELYGEESLTPTEK